MSFPTHYIKKRDTLHSEKSSPATLAQIGREFLAAQRYSDALDFFEKAKDAQGIAQIKDYALQNGDTFLIGRLDRYDDQAIIPFSTALKEVFGQTAVKKSSVKEIDVQGADDADVTKLQD